MLTRGSRQFVRPKAKRNQIEPGKKEQAVRKQKPPAVTVREKDLETPTKLRGLAYACERQRQLREEQGKASSAAAPGRKSQHTKADGVGRANGSQSQKQREKHHRRRVYEREDSEDSSSDSSNENADNQDLWFLSRKGNRAGKEARGGDVRSGPRRPTGEVWPPGCRQDHQSREDQPEIPYEVPAPGNGAPPQNEPPEHRPIVCNSQVWPEGFLRDRSSPEGRLAGLHTETQGSDLASGSDHLLSDCWRYRIPPPERNLPPGP